MGRYGWSGPAGLTGILVAVLAFGGCTQASNQALVRQPGNRLYDEPAGLASVSAKDLWEYAVMSENTYTPTAEGGTAGEASPYVRACVPEPRTRLPLDGWKRWEDFPDEKLRQTAKGLYFEVWETTTRPSLIAVAFRGTEMTDAEDWKANFRW